MKHFVNYFIVLLISLLCLPPSAVSAKNSETLPDHPEFKKKFAVGIDYLGGDIHYGFKKVWSTEIRFLTDQTSSDLGNLNTYVMGARLDRHFKTDQKLQYYAGVEGAYVFSFLKNSDTTSSHEYNTRGEAFGIYGGIQFYVSRPSAPAP